MKKIPSFVYSFIRLLDYSFFFMNILMLTPYLSFPLLSGGQTRSYNLLKNLSKKHDVTLFSFIRRDEEMQYKEELLKYCKKIELVKRRPAWSSVNKLLAGFTKYPFLVAIYLSHTLQKTLRKELKDTTYDLIHAETFYVMPNIAAGKVPILLVEQTIEYRVYQHFVQNSAPFFLRPLLWFDVWKVKYWEKHYWSKAKQVVAMSHADKDQMQSVMPGLTVNIVPNGVDVTQFSARQNDNKKRKTILYVGNFKWLQNREAVVILINEVWPKIKKEIQDVELRIVGRGLTPELKALQTDEVIFDEHVHDIRSVYAEADLMIAPIEGPGGTRLKILEAMASGCPVVTTHVGIEGIDAKHNQEVLVGRTSKDLALCAITLLKDTKLSQKLTQNAKKLVGNQYNWQDITNELDRIYGEVAHGHKH